MEITKYPSAKLIQIPLNTFMQVAPLHPQSRTGLSVTTYAPGLLRFSKNLHKTKKSSSTYTRVIHKDFSTQSEKLA